MAQQIINVGTNANDGTGDTLRTAGQKVNSNFTEVYGTAQSAFNKANTANALAQAAYNYANTIVSDTQIDPYARSKANAAFDVSNSAFIHANAAFNQANTGGANTGDITFSGTTISANDITIESVNAITLTSGFGGNNRSWSLEDTGILKVPGAVNFKQNATIPLAIPGANGVNDRVTLWDFEGTGSGFNYAIGVEGNHIWFTMDVDNGTGGFKFYSRDNEVLKITDRGNIVSNTSQVNFVPNSSGDGNGYSTIELRPDVSLLSDQYIVIDPTSPGHIHIRAGGTQDASGSYLYFGGEQAHLQIEDDNHSVYIRTYDSSTSTLHTWAFNGVGSITFPDATEQTTAAGVPGFRKLISINSSTHNASNTEEILLCDPNGAGSNIVVNLSSDVNDGKIFTIKNINPGGYSVNVAATTIEDPVSKSLVSEVIMANTGEVYTWVSESGVYRHIG